MNSRRYPSEPARNEPSPGRPRGAKTDARLPGIPWLRRPPAWKWRWASAGTVAAVLILIMLRQPLADWLWPQTRAQKLRDEAAQALMAGRLSSADGRGARELYEAALALDPDRADARDGLNRVGHAALAQARAAMARRQYAQARQALQLARELAIPRAQVDAMSEQLRKHEAATTAIPDLLEQAAAARAEGRLDGERDSALALYQRVLELEPARIEALEGREDTLSDLLQQAAMQRMAGDLAAASAIVHRVQAADAGHVELPDALAELNRAAERRRLEAGRQLRRNRLTQALDGYRAALRVNPEDAQAREGIIEVAAAHARNSERLAADFRFSQAEAELDRANAIASEVAADVPAIGEARTHLSRARQTQRRMYTRLPPAQRQRRLATLLTEAAQARARGDLITPPGDSAFDKLSTARAIAPNDPRVKAAIARLVPSATTCYHDALRDNRLVRAGACLDAVGAMQGDTAAVLAGRRELASRWIAMGDQRLDAGEVQGAQAALAAARALDPAAQGLTALADRVRAAAVTARSEEP